MSVVLNSGQLLFCLVLPTSLCLFVVQCTSEHCSNMPIWSEINTSLTLQEKMNSTRLIYLPKENFDTSETDKKLQTFWQTEFSPNYRKPTKHCCYLNTKKITSYISRRMNQMPFSPTAWVNGHLFTAKMSNGQTSPVSYLRDDGFPSCDLDAEMATRWWSCPVSILLDPNATDDFKKAKRTTTFVDDDLLLVSIFSTKTRQGTKKAR